VPVLRSDDIGLLPRLADFTHHKTLRDIDFDGVHIPGLDAAFYRRPVGDRLLSVGVYRFRGAETHRAWGWVGDAHCSWHAYRTGGPEAFAGPFPGCPPLRVLGDAGAVLGFELGAGGLRRVFAVYHGPLESRPAGVDDRRDRDRQGEDESGALEPV
jgi:hypothetical protein